MTSSNILDKTGYQKDKKESLRSSISSMEIDDIDDI